MKNPRFLLCRPALFTFLALQFSPPVLAAEGEVQSLSPSHALQVLLSLVLVLALIFGLVWLMRRAGQGSWQNTRQLKVLASLALGQREKVVVVAIGDEQIVLGVTPQQVSLLKTLEQPLPIVESSLNMQSFGEKLKEVLAQRQ